METLLLQLSFIFLTFFFRDFNSSTYLSISLTDLGSLELKEKKRNHTDKITTIIIIQMSKKTTKNFLGLDPDQFSTGEGPGHLYSILKYNILLKWCKLL